MARVVNWLLFSPVVRLLCNGLSGGVENICDDLSSFFASGGAVVSWWWGVGFTPPL